MPISPSSAPNSNLSSFSQLLWAVLPGLLCAIAILYPFLLSGGEFLYLDWAGSSGDLRALSTFVHSMQTNGFAARWLPIILLDALSTLILGPASAAIFPKLFFISLFIAASSGLWLLLRQSPRPLYLLAVAILCFSPFAYERILIGQWGVVAALFCAPLVLYFTDRMLHSPSRANAFWAALALSAGTFFLIQGLLLDLGLILLMFVFSLQPADWPRRRMLVHTAMLFTLGFILINLFWLLPVLLNPFTSLTALQIPSNADPFQPSASTGLNTLFKSAAQYGVWREAPMLLGLNTLPLPLILFILVGMVGLCIYALVSFPKRPLVRALALGWLIGIILATGLSHPWTQSVFGTLLGLPLFGGFRDSNKFIHLIALAYAILVPLGLQALLSARQASMRALWLLSLVAISLILVYNYPAFGLSGQLRPITTPVEYRTMADGVPPGQQALYLPQSIYQTYQWSLAIGMDGRVPNQASRYGYSSVITLFAPEFDYAVNPPREARLAACLDARNATCLLQNNQSIILADYCALASGAYDWLYAQYQPYQNGTCFYWYNLSAGPKNLTALKVPNSS